MIAYGNKGELDVNRDIFDLNQDLYNIVNSYGNRLPIGIVYYVFQSVLQDIETIYQNSILNEEEMEEEKEQIISQEVEIPIEDIQELEEV